MALPVKVAGMLIVAGAAFAAFGSGAVEYRAAGAGMEMVVGQSSLDARGVFSFDGGRGPMLMSPANGASIQLIALACDGHRTKGGLSGTCEMTDRDGDVVSSRWQCEMTAPPGRIAMACEGRAVVTDGSGKFGGAKGDNAMLLFLPAAQQNAATGYAVWPTFCLTLADHPEALPTSVPQFLQETLPRPLVPA
jgi:hypothetical protein